MPNEYILVNAYDELVKSKVREIIEADDNMCGCEKCFLDVCALVFNNGYSNFITTRKGQVLTNASESKNSKTIDLTVTVMDAVKKVKMSPLH